ncbi:MAG: threonine synthase [Actinobacteria bacterium]|nr:threonine synthase [Actinomycetota bacterium]MCL5882541.1 threonine synthase [Actinomycetota bacterium]
MSNSGPRDRSLIERYRQFLPVSDATPVISLAEGSTPLLSAPRLGERLGLNLFLKLEGLNPTGSFKDRGMTLAVSKGIEEGASAVICASTGNTSASAAAYAGRAGIRCIVIIPEGKIAAGKLAQAVTHGAQVLSVSGNFDQALEIVRGIVDKHPVQLVNSINPYRLEGQKTGAFEVVDSLGRAPDFLAIPVGNAGNITAYWKGFNEYREAGKCDGVPRMIGFQAAGAAPLVIGHPVKDPETIATAIRIGNPARGDQALAAAGDSSGLIDSVTDEEIIAAYKLVASTEGTFCEPASAASIAGVIKKHREGLFQEGDTVVCVLTGHGLKDPDTAIANGAAVISIAADFDQVVKTLGL